MVMRARAVRAGRRDRVERGVLEHAGGLAKLEQFGDAIEFGEPALGRGLLDPAQEAAERGAVARSEEHTSELQSLMRISYAVFCLKNTNRIATATQFNITRQREHMGRIHILPPPDTERPICS